MHKQEPLKIKDLTGPGTAKNPKTHDMCKHMEVIQK
jgi:hypothetical protein